MTKQIVDSHMLAISPLDGRYAKHTQALADYFSEFALFKYRTIVEIAWFKKLAATPEIKEVPPLSPNAMQALDSIVQNFNIEAAKEIKTIEQTINHDVKAVEYFLKKHFSAQPDLAPYQEFIHFACTSEDINNVSYALMLKEASQKVLFPAQQALLKRLKDFAHLYASLPMLARTHGQTATPTSVGKEFANFAYRFQKQLKGLERSDICAKINGAVGNFNAHQISYPEVNWLKLSQEFIESFGLSWNPLTTQIEPHDYLANFLSRLTNANLVLIDLARDIWAYISLGYFTQKMRAEEVGSSTMPHKINPIDFENAEGNLYLANGMAEVLNHRLPISRWQRDLVDSTLLRNIGVSLAYSLIAYKSLQRGLDKLAVNEQKLAADLDQHWEVLAEAIQTVMRRYGLPEPYEQLKALSRGQSFGKKEIQTFIAQLDLPELEKNKLLALTPSTYVGLCVALVGQGIDNEGNNLDSNN